MAAGVGRLADEFVLLDPECDRNVTRMPAPFGSVSPSAAGNRNYSPTRVFSASVAPGAEAVIAAATIVEHNRQAGSFRRIDTTRKGPVPGYFPAIGPRPSAQLPVVAEPGLDVLVGFLDVGDLRFSIYTGPSRGQRISIPCPASSR